MKSTTYQTINHAKKRAQQKNRAAFSEAQSTIVGLKAQDCPGGGWTGQPKEIERATVADCLAHGVCGCIFGDAVKHIDELENLRALLRAIERLRAEIELVSK